MASTFSSTRAEPRFDGAVPTVSGATPMMPKDPFGGVEETLARLAHRAAGDTRDARPRAPASDKPADARISPSSAAPTLGPAALGAATLGPADLSAQIPREPRSLGRLRILANVAIVVCIGAAVIWGWRSYGGPAKEVIAAFIPRSDVASARSVADQPPVPQTPDPAPGAAPDPAPAQAAAPAAVPPAAPPAQSASTAPPAATPAAPPPTANAPAAASVDQQQLDAMARDLASLRQTIDQLTTGQAQLKDEIAKLQAEKAAAAKPPPEKPKKRVVHHAPPADHPADAFNPALNPGAPGAPRTIGTVVEHGGPAPYPPPVTSSSLVPPPPPGLERRPPAAVPQP